MTFEESLETTKIYSIAGALPTMSGLCVSVRSVRRTTPLARGLLAAAPFRSRRSVACKQRRAFPRRAAGVFSKRNGNTAPACRGRTITISRWRVRCRSRSGCRLRHDPCPCGYFGHPQSLHPPEGAAASILMKVSGRCLTGRHIHRGAAGRFRQAATGNASPPPISEARKPRPLNPKAAFGTGACNARMDSP